MMRVVALMLEEKKRSKIQSERRASLGGVLWQERVDPFPPALALGRTATHLSLVWAGPSCQNGVVPREVRSSGL